MKKNIALGLTGLLVAGSLAFTQLSPVVFANDTENTVVLNVSDTDESAMEEKTEEEKTESKGYGTLETINLDGAEVTAVDVSGVVEAVMPSVVMVTEKGKQEVMDWFGRSREYEVEGAASGFIIAQNSDELLIATNNHVVQDSSEVTVEFSVDAEDEDDLLVPAKVKGTDPTTDLAVIAVNVEDIDEDVFNQLKVAVLGNSDKLKVGQSAITIGNTLGEGISVTSGIISALDVEITVEDGSTFTEFQTDGAANQGQSGGMIVNSKGEVIGIFNAGYLSGDNVGYGIPVSTAIPVLQELINRETREKLDDHGYMGVSIIAVSTEASDLYNIPEGAYVYEVTKDSAADKAGLEKGDIIVGFDGITVNSKEALLRQVSYYAPGEVVEITIMKPGDRGYEEKKVEVTLEEAPEEVKASLNEVEEQPQYIQGGEDPFDNWIVDIDDLFK